MKRIISLILFVCLLGSVAMADELHLKVLNPDLYPVTDGDELTVWCGQDGNVADYVINPQNAALEALTGVKINWITAPGTQADMNVVFNLSIASGDYPDIYINSIGTGDVMTYANDVFIPLNDLIDKTYWIKKYLDEDPSIREAITAPDGNIYTLWGGLPVPDVENYYAYPYKLWIYRPWLEASGLDMPETIDEYREYLRYVRDNDMNGNGDTTDELGMFGSFAFDHDGSDPTYGIMQAFTVTPANFLWVNDDLSIDCVAISDDFREGLIYLRSMYDEGLISEDMYALTLNEFRDVVNATTASEQVVGSAGGPLFMRFVTPSVFGSRAFDEFTYMPVLKKDANSVAQTWKRKSAPGLKVSITVNCKNPELAMAWLDACMDPEILHVTYNGNEDEYWTRLSADGEIPIQYQLIDGKELKDGGTVNNHTFGNWVFPSLPPSYTKLQLVDGTDAWKMNTYQQAANTLYIESATTDALPALAWCDDDDIITEYTELQSVIEGAISTAYAEFILGRKDINDDTVWEEYKQNLEYLGLSRYLDVVKAYYFGK